MWTPSGPRARTLASFATLTAEILGRAERAARTPFDRAAVERAARRLGLPFEANAADALAGSLLRVLARGDRIRPGLQRQLLDCLAPGRRSDDSFTEWIGATPEARGAALVELLDLTDSLPKSRPGPLEFPGLSPARLR